MSDSPVPAKARTWAEVYHDKVAEWLRPFRAFYRVRGFDFDDVLQEARLALCEEDAYLSRITNDGYREHTARLIARREVRRQLVGRSKAVPPLFDADGSNAVNHAEDRAHRAHVQIEIAEMVEAAPAGPVRMYLRSLFAGPKDDHTNAVHELPSALRAEAAKHVTEWFSTFNWRHDS